VFRNLKVWVFGLNLQFSLALIFLVFSVAMFSVSVHALTYRIMVTVEEDDEMVWEKTYWIDVDGGNATVRIPQRFFDEFISLIDNRTFITPFALYIVNTTTDSLASLYVESDPSSLTVILEPAFSGDMNFDGKVDYYDLCLFRLAWLSEQNDPDYNSDADLNFDGRVDYRDLDIFGRNWGKGT